jgi:dihydrofolate synthase / folylpolyglutamate synthase
MAKPTTLQEWLAYIEALHPKSIAMGLDRVSIVAKRLGLTPTFKIITVAGTNGKGSTCAMLTQIYTDAGYHVGTYTSPHLIHYHERVKINAQPVTDDTLCNAFLAVENARADIELTYFEIATLAAVWHFMQAKVDIAILEVGMGGRLDAVNLFDADCAIVTNIDLDHMEYLGDTRELIGAEKAGVYRQHQISICGDLTPPQSLLAYAQKIGTTLKVINTDYRISFENGRWIYQDAEGQLILPTLALVGEFQIQNAASVIYAVRALGAKMPVASELMLDALANVQLMGRFQFLQRNPDVIVDVAHNPHAARSLKENIEQMQVSGRVVVVFSMLVDKDIASVVDILRGSIDEWHIAPIDHPRAAPIAKIMAMLAEQGVTQPIYSYATLEMAMQAACKKIAKNDKIIAFGSFFTVASILAFWQRSKDDILFRDKA